MNNAEFVTAVDGSTEQRTEDRGSQVEVMASVKPVSVSLRPNPQDVKAKKVYPFETKAQISKKIEESSLYVTMALTLLHDWQTEDEKEQGKTQHSNKRGFTLSHAKLGSRLAEQVKQGHTLNAEDLDRARWLVSHYTRQLAEYSRILAMRENPELAITAQIFGLRVG